MIHAARAALTQSITANGDTYKNKTGPTFLAIPSPLVTILAAGQLDGLNIGNTVTGPNGQVFVVLDSKCYGDTCALTLVPQAILAQ